MQESIFTGFCIKATCDGCGKVVENPNASSQSWRPPDWYSFSGDSVVLHRPHKIESTTPFSFCKIIDACGAKCLVDKIVEVLALEEE